MTQSQISKQVWVLLVAIITFLGLPSHAGSIGTYGQVNGLHRNHLGHYNRLHPFHTSIGDCQYNPKTRHLEFSIRLFTDDLEQALTTFGKAPFVLDNKRSAEALLTQYLLRHIKVSQQSTGATWQPIILSVVGKETANDVTWVYLESADCLATGLTFRQSCLTDQFDDQQNILNIEMGKQNRTLMFDGRHPERSL
jgi:hypothetical protein